VLTGASDPMNDSVQEWFPALAQRNSQTTLQGKEWTWGAKFIPAILEYQNLQTCSLGVVCVESQAQKLGLSFEYVYVTLAYCTSDQSCRYHGATLVESLKKSPDYRLVYENKNALVFETNRHNVAP